MENSGHGAGKQYLEAALDRLEWVLRAQHEQIAAAGAAVAKAIAAGGWWFLFGTGHSHMLAEEAFYRAGDSAGCADSRRFLDAPRVRRPEYADRAVERSGRDLVPRTRNYGTTCSSSHRTRAQRGDGRDGGDGESPRVFTIAVTSLAHSRKASSRRRAVSGYSKWPTWSSTTGRRTATPSLP